MLIFLKTFLKLHFRSLSGRCAYTTPLFPDFEDFSRPMNLKCTHLEQSRQLERNIVG